MELHRLHILTFVINVKGHFSRYRMNMHMKYVMKLETLHILTPVIYVSRNLHSDIDCIFIWKPTWSLRYSIYWLCYVCAHTFSFRSYLKGIWKRTRSLIDSIYCCYICVQRFSFRSRLNIPMKTNMKLEVLHVLTPVLFVFWHFCSDLDWTFIWKRTWSLRYSTYWPMFYLCQGIFIQL